jgi:hypothetical protein
MFVEDCVLFPMPAAPPRVTIVGACRFHLIFHSLRCQRQSEREAELSVTELRPRERLSGSVMELSDESA